MSLHRRLEKLEVADSTRSHAADGEARRALEQYFRALENWRREEAGLGPLPYTEENRRADEEFLDEVLPIYRQNPGWQTEEAQEKLDAWERDTRERLTGQTTPKGR